MQQHLIKILKKKIRGLLDAVIYSDRFSLPWQVDTTVLMRVSGADIGSAGQRPGEQRGEETRSEAPPLLVFSEHSGDHETSCFTSAVTLTISFSLGRRCHL